MDYKGLKIPDKIIIVEKQINPMGARPRELPQGYVIPVGDTKQLQSAHNWADWKEGKWDGNHYVYGKTYPGIEHTYENGKFKMTVKESAEGSWQGGKLSFWTCEIEAPDGKKFDIGINSDYLCETIMFNTLIKGTVQADIWLGKVKGNTMAITKDQPSFEQAMHDEKKRNEKQTAKYEPGDVVKTLTQTEIYIGQWYQQFSIHTFGDYWRSNNYKVEFRIKLNAKPIPRYAFCSLLSDREGNEFASRGITLSKTKPKRVVPGERKPELITDYYERTMEDQRLRVQDRRTGKHGDRIYIYNCDPSVPIESLYPLMYTKTQETNVDLDEVIKILQGYIWGHASYGKITICDESGTILKSVEI